MTLNFNISNIAANAANQAQASSNVEQSASEQAARANDFSALSITRGTASAEDIAAASISESALVRDDPLGNLVKSAYNLPPPPPPWEML